MHNEIRVILASRKTGFRSSLNEFLTAQPGVRVLATPASGEEVLQSVQTLAPDILLVDLSLTDMTGLDVIGQLDGKTTARAIVLTEVTDTRMLTRAVLRGASGAIARKAPLPLLLKCIRSVATGDFWFDRNLTPALLEHLDSLEDRRDSANRRSERLTHREREVFQAVAHGMSNREIAVKLGLSEHTVKQHLKRIFEKLDVSSRVELVLLVARSGLYPHRRRKTNQTRRA